MLPTPTEATWFYAVAQGDKTTVRRLVADFRGYVNIDGDTALIQACRANNLEMVRLLVPYEAGLTSTMGYTALMVAALSNNPSLCEILAPLEKDIILDDGRDSYMLAAQVGAAAALLMMTKNFKLRQDKARLNALDYAVNSGYLDCVNIILSSQKVSHIELKYAINVAAENHFVDIERALIAFKSNLRRSLTLQQQPHIPRSKSRSLATSQAFQTSVVTADPSPSPRQAMRQPPMLLTQHDIPYMDSETSSAIDHEENQRLKQSIKMLNHKLAELTNIIQIKENEIITLQMQSMRLQPLPTSCSTFPPTISVEAPTSVSSQIMTELTERVRHLEDAYAKTTAENKDLQTKLYKMRQDDALSYEDLEFIRPKTPQHTRLRSKSTASTPKEKSRPRTPVLCAPKRSMGDCSENVFTRQSGKYLGDLPLNSATPSITTEQFDSIIAEKNNTIEMLQELLSEYQSRGVADLQASVGYQEIKAESNSRVRSSSRLNTSSLFGRGKSIRKDSVRGSTNFDTYRKNTILQLAERDKEIHLLREQLASFEGDGKGEGNWTPNLHGSNKEELMDKVLAQQTAKITELQELLEATELHGYMPMTETVNSLNDKLKAQERTIEGLLKDNEALKKELSERPQHDDSKLCKILANSRVSVRGLTDSFCASTTGEPVETISSTRDLIALLAEKDTEIERLRELINSMPEFDPDRLEPIEASPKKIQCLLEELELKNQEIDDLRVSLSNTMTRSRRSVSLSKTKKKERSRVGTPVLTDKNAQQNLNEENEKLNNEIQLLTERVRGLEEENSRLNKERNEANSRFDMASYDNTAKMKKTIDQLRAANERLIAENDHLKDRVHRAFSKNAERANIAHILDDIKEGTMPSSEVVALVETPSAHSCLAEPQEGQQADDGQNSTARLTAALGIGSALSPASTAKQSDPSALLQEKEHTIMSLHAEIQEKNEEIDRLKYIISKYNADNGVQSTTISSSEEHVTLSTISDTLKQAKKQTPNTDLAASSGTTISSSMGLSSTSLAKSRSAFGRCKSVSLQNSRIAQKSHTNSDYSDILALQRIIKEKDEEIQKLRSYESIQHTASTPNLDPGLESEIATQREKIKLITLAANEQELEINQLKAEIQRLTLENHTLLNEIQTYSDDMDILRETQEKLKAVESTIEYRDNSIAEAADRLRALVEENKQLQEDKRRYETELQAISLVKTSENNSKYSGLLASKDGESMRLRELIEYDKNKEHTNQKTLVVSKSTTTSDIDTEVDLIVERLADPPKLLSYEETSQSPVLSFVDINVDKISVVYDVLDDILEEHYIKETTLCHQVTVLQRKVDELECAQLRQASLQQRTLSSVDIAESILRCSTPDLSDDDSSFLLVKRLQCHEQPILLNNYMSKLLKAKDSEIERLQQLLLNLTNTHQSSDSVAEDTDQGQEAADADLDSLIIENTALSSEVDLLNLSISIQNNVISTIADHYLKKNPLVDQVDPSVALLEGKVLSLSEQLAQADGQVTQLRAEAHSSKLSLSDVPQKHSTTVFLPRSHPFSEFRTTSALRTSIDQDPGQQASLLESSTISALSLPDTSIIGLVKPSVAPIVTSIIKSAEQNVYEPLKQPSALMNAITTGDLRAIGANLQQVGYTLEDGTTALMLAAEHNISAAVKYLAEFEANKRRSDGKRAIDIALERDHLRMATLLLSWEGADVSKYSSEGNRVTELMTAAAEGDLYMVLNLLGLQKKLQDSNGKTALMYACEAGQVSCAKLLLVEKDILDNCGKGPIDYIRKDLASYYTLKKFLTSSLLNLRGSQ